MKNVIVTGANGFVGSAVVQKLLTNKYNVTAIVNERLDSIFKIKETHDFGFLLKIIQCSQEDYDKLPVLLKQNEYDTLFHFAWVGSSGKKRADELVQLNNIESLTKLIRICSDLGLNKVIMASSIMEYEVISSFRENIPISSSSLYSIAKFSADVMARIICDNLNIKYCSAVISNIYGPGEKSPRLINSSIRKILNNQRCSFSSGNQPYDFIYIDDAAQAIVCIGTNGKNRSSYYVGNRQRLPLKSFLSQLGEVLNHPELIGLGDIDDSFVCSFDDNMLDISLLYKDTDFSPMVSFKEGIIRTAEWIKLNL